MLEPSHDAQLIVAADASGAVVHCAQGLSFWGGVDPDSGAIIDAHHPNCGAELAGRIVLMPSSRGSCSGSGVLLQLALSSKAPAALVFCENEETLTLGAVIADRLFQKPVAVLRLSRALFEALAASTQASLKGEALRFGQRQITLRRPARDGLALSAADRKSLTGENGLPQQIAMEVTCTMAAAQGADGLIDVSRGHIDGCILAHDANLIFAETMQSLGARTKIPTTINAISVDREHWMSQGVDKDFGSRASRLADAYVAMGALPTFTCAPYLLDDVPGADEAIGWSESNAVIYANSVLGARTEKHPDYLDLFIAMTGRAPNTGVYQTENRRADCVINVELPDGADESVWPMLGWLAGMKSPNAIPLITGLEAAKPTDDDLKALCAAFGTTSAAPMLSIAGHTPESHLPPKTHARTEQITSADLLTLWRDFNQGNERTPGETLTPVDLVAIGSPHASLTECRRVADLIQADKRQLATHLILTVGRQVHAAAEREGIARTLTDAGAQLIADLCWCSITEPVYPAEARVVMTNSGKYAHYAQALTGREIRFGSLEDCVEAAITRHASAAPPEWLTTRESQ
ncbi:MAG: aconitase X [Congregibacter sp.]